jgi:hypothetical protein
MLAERDIGHGAREEKRGGMAAWSCEDAMGQKSALFDRRTGVPAARLSLPASRDRRSHLIQVGTMHATHYSYFVR